jgi:hypothetical protein
MSSRPPPGLLSDAVGPLDVSGLFGLGGLGHGLVEPCFLLALGVLEFDHEAVEEVCVANEKAEVVVGAAGLLAQLGAGGGGDVVGLGERHLLLLLWW